MPINSIPADEIEITEMHWWRLQEFELHHLYSGNIEDDFAEFAAYRGLCRFNNCRHLHEPGCVLIKAAQEGMIKARRLKLFQDITPRNLKPSFRQSYLRQ